LFRPDLTFDKKKPMIFYVGDRGTLKKAAFGGRRTTKLKALECGSIGVFDSNSYKPYARHKAAWK
jgi:hypothetical protein